MDISEEDLIQIGLGNIQTYKDTTGRFRVPPGTYYIKTFVAKKLNNSKCEFMLRIFSDEKIDAK